MSLDKVKTQVLRVISVVGKGQPASAKEIKAALSPYYENSELAEAIRELEAEKLVTHDKDMFRLIRLD